MAIHGRQNLAKHSAVAQRRAGDSALWTAIASVEHNGRWLSILSFCALTLVLCAWRLHCVTLGPDPDTDAYGHYMIARQLLETPENLRIHWVWLPSYHALLALGVWLGVSLDGVRCVNAMLAAVPPLLLFFGLARGRAGEAPTFVPWLAAVLALGAPLAVQMGTTGQMEVWFSCLLLGIALALRHERHA